MLILAGGDHGSKYQVYLIRPGASGHALLRASQSCCQERRQKCGTARHFFN